jgi:hypothetical protein
MIDEHGIHRKTLELFNNDLKVVYLLSDSQGRIRDLMKNYYAEFIKVHESGEGIGTSSSIIIDIDGEENFKEKTKSVEAYVNYARQLITDKHGFVKDDLISVVTKINTNSSFRIIKNTINWVVDKYTDPKEHKLIDEFMSLVVIQTLFLIENNI